MMKLLVLLSGPVAVGKSSVAADLISVHNFERISTRYFLSEVANRRGIANNRTILQQIGDSLDDQTDYRWVVDDVAVPAISNSPNVEYWLVDSVRKERQVQHFKERYGAQSFHVYLDAPEALLQERYQTRLSASGECPDDTPYHIVIQHPNEVSSRKLIDVADAVIDVTGLTSGEIAKEVLTQSSTRR